MKYIFETGSNYISTSEPYYLDGRPGSDNIVHKQVWNAMSKSTEDNGGNGSGDDSWDDEPTLKGVSIDSIETDIHPSDTIKIETINGGSLTLGGSDATTGIQIWDGTNMLVSINSVPYPYDASAIKQALNSDTLKYFGINSTHCFYISKNNIVFALWVDVSKDKNDSDVIWAINPPFPEDQPEQRPNEDPPSE